MIASNKKTFFRNLGKEQLPVEKPPKKAGGSNGKILA